MKPKVPNGLLVPRDASTVALHLIEVRLSVNDKSPFAGDQHRVGQSIARVNLLISPKLDIVVSTACAPWRMAGSNALRLLRAT